MKKISHTTSKVEARKKRVRAKISGTAQRPRVSVFRSNKHLFLQAIDDQLGVVVASVHDKSVRKDLKKGESLTKIEAAIKSAEVLAKALKAKKVTAAVLDRGPYRYHGRVRAVADALRAQEVNI